MLISSKSYLIQVFHKTSVDILLVEYLWCNSRLNCMLQCVSSWLVDMIWDRCNERIVVCSGLKCLRRNSGVN